MTPLPTPRREPGTGGNPLLLNAERQRQIIHALAAGSTRADAAAYAQISYSSLKRWLALGRDCAERHADLIEAEADVLDDPDWVFFQFASAVEEAEARPMIAALGTVHDAIRGGDADRALKAATWWLRYAAERKTIGSTEDDAALDDETLRVEGLALVEEIKRRERADAEVA